MSVCRYSQYSLVLTMEGLLKKGRLIKTKTAVGQRQERS